MSSVMRLPYGRPLTWVDLESAPDDGHRYELIDGVLIVSPAPRPLHQRVVVQLVRKLTDACPPEFEALVAPVDVRLANDTLVQPDLIVARRSDLTDRGLVLVPPLLAVEVLSPGNRGIDLVSKRNRYESAGCPSYWLIDPEVPSILALELRDGSYVEAAEVKAEETFHAAMPYPLSLTPAELVA
ncbi:Uma2 family endonuclease [Actinopolymorpha alba]|uniref:Uma2 family endonuclease n=1 Tax=Actinopolymorpha alba TaxID=533267 RepID=UPI0003714818|nr:Uma2 family endonuclease [Actinopolymorpha alba]